MNRIGKKSFDLGYMDTLASGDSFLHRLDPRAKVIVTLAFIVAVVSFDKYSLSGLTPFFIFPMAMIFAGGLPAGYLTKKILLVAPFAVLIGIFNPLIDGEAIMSIGSISISGGWVSFLSIMLRFILTVSAALILVSLTGFNSVCESLLKFGVPKPFVVQLMFFNRYMFTLTDEAGRMVRARMLRSFNSRHMDFGMFTSFTGQLLLRTLDRAERIYQAMLCRGFYGHIHIFRPLKFGFSETIYVSGWVALFIFLRFINLPFLMGSMVAGSLK